MRWKDEMMMEEDGRKGDCLTGLTGEAKPLVFVNHRVSSPKGGEEWRIERR